MKRIYFMRRTDGTGPIKIGCSRYPEGRRKQIGSDTKADYVILAQAPGGYLLEGNLHFKFSAHREVPEWAGTRPYPVGGSNEWFKPVRALLSLIEQVQRDGVIKLAPQECREQVYAQRYLAGETLQEIAADYGITRERVRQVLRQVGVPSLGQRSEICKRAARKRWLARRIAA